MECRSVVMLAVVVGLLTGQPVVADEAEDRAIAYIEKIGGELKPDPTDREEPTDSVILAYTRVTDGGLKHLASFPQLRTLDLTRTRVTGAGLKHLAPLQALRVLELNESSVTDADLKELAPLQQLTHLFLSDTQVTDAGMKELARLKGLTSLRIDNTKVTDAGLKELTSLQGLTSLNLSDTKVTGAGVKQLSSLKTLRYLELNGTKVTDADIKELASLPALASLSLYGTNITDAGIKELVASKWLSMLRLSGSRVTDAGIKELAHAKHLVELTLINTEVTDDGVAFLKKTLPECSAVRHRVIPFPKPRAAVPFTSAAPGQRAVVDKTDPLAAGTRQREIAPFPRRTPPLSAAEMIVGTWKYDNENSRPLRSPEFKLMIKLSENETIDVTDSEDDSQQKAGTYCIRDNILQIDLITNDRVIMKRICIIYTLIDNQLILKFTDSTHREIYRKIKQ